jgi:hypothetical protein
MSRAFSRAAGVAVLVTLLAALPGLTTSALASPAAQALSSPVQVAALVPPKIVIVVGATEAVTPTYRSDADQIYAEAIKWTPNVVKIYSPNATWAAVKAAAQGASIFIYLGHGYGFPSPYKTVLTPIVHDGMGLNQFLNQGDSDKVYYGESYVGSEIRLAKNAIVILNHLCYSAGSSEAGNPEPTIAVAKERVDNFASGFLRAGARVVLADSWNSAPIQMIHGLFTTHESIGTLWHSLSSTKNHDIAWTPLRNPAYTAVMDPDTATTGFHRSIVGNLDMQTNDVLAGAGVKATNLDPATLQAPGAAATTAAVPLFTDSALTTPTGTQLPLGARLRVAQVVPSAPLADGTTPPPAVQVTTLDGATTGWVGGAQLAPRDSVGPQLWAMDGATTVSPNYDGSHDTLSLLARFSESVTWTARILNSASAVVATLTGTGDSAIIAWNPIAGGVVPPDGDYTWSLHAVDGWGNAALDATGTFHLASSAPPSTGVLTFRPTAATTNASAIGYSLVFAGSVTGLTAADFSVTGTATGCVIGAPVGSAATYTVTVSGCSSGRLVVTLQPGAVTDGLAIGPAGGIAAGAVTIDRTAPTVTAPKVALASTGTLPVGALPASVAWTGTDTGGAGIGSYDVAQSTDGGVFAVVRFALPGASLALSLAPGHSYRFEVRATDRASNRGSWVAGPTLYPTLVQQSTGVLYTGTWTSVYSAVYSGGSARYSSAPGSTASYGFSGRNVGLVMSRGPSRGQVAVYIDGAYAVTVDLYAATSSYAQIVFGRTLPAYGAHTIKITVVGTAGRPVALLDAVELIR